MAKAGDKLTEDEHHTRAMLMGMVYNPRKNFYYDRGDKNFQVIDAHTLQPIRGSEIIRRMIGRVTND